MNFQNQQEAQVWFNFRNGDDKALALIYSGTAKILYQYGLKFTSNTDIIEDSIQDLFSDLIRNRRNLGETDNIEFYLLKSFRRKLLRQLQYESRFTDKEFTEVMFGVRYSIEQEIISNESYQDLSKQLFDAIEKLSPRQKEAIYLKFTKGLEYEEISQILDMGVEACRNLIYRAVKSL
ncbi:MAG: sigma-70 family RNA polymerase sigma factor, partial [Bacteroidota bacterium]|nr:sigma-70 family RNA polymerase sigma factor [Bacteroidota bacterium]